MADRAQFEAWMASRNLAVERDGDSYSLTYARRAWEAWQAASAIQAARVAELEAALQLIAETDPVDAALDPHRAIRVAAALLTPKEPPDA